jgi:hypothetical protein
MVLIEIYSIKVLIDTTQQFHPMSVIEQHILREEFFYLSVLSSQKL